MLLDNRNNLKKILIIGAFIVVSLILWNTYRFFQMVKKEERAKMEIWAEAHKTLNGSELGADLPLVLEVLSKNKTIPLILTDSVGLAISYNNISLESFEKDQEHLLERFKKQNKPIVIDLGDSVQYLYYGNSPLLTKLTYYPFALLVILLLFLLVITGYFKTNRISAQNKLWIGMAKETAHQIGTPLSSLLGWAEILRAEGADENVVLEIEKDIMRLQTIADRFSKVGSKPVLEKVDMIEHTRKSYEYLKVRFSNQITFVFQAPDYPLYLMLNPILHGWTIENLIKNAVDATKGKGNITVRILDEVKQVKILIEDTGKGIPKREFDKIFEPGFTTKKRGWGLGLSLTKRIVEEYHGGRVKVLTSEEGKGTTMQISYPQYVKSDKVFA